MSGWLDDHWNWNRRAWNFAAKKTVPIHRHSIWYYFGGMTLFLFSIQVDHGHSAACSITAQR